MVPTASPLVRVPLSLTTTTLGVFGGWYLMEKRPWWTGTAGMEMVSV
jgi:hypothetical protein